MTEKVTLQIAQDEVRSHALQSLNTKFPNSKELTERYTAFFEKLPPVPYLHVFNNEFFGFLRTTNEEKEVVAWLIHPPFEQHMAAFAKLPGRQYLSGFHAFAFQHQDPQTLETSDFDMLHDSNNESKESMERCNTYKTNFKLKFAPESKTEKCPRCKVGTIAFVEKRTRMGADEALSAVRQCVNCRFQGFNE